MTFAVVRYDRILAVGEHTLLCEQGMGDELEKNWVRILGGVIIGAQNQLEFAPTADEIGQ